MNVMLNPSLGMVMPYRGVSSAVKPTTENLTKSTHRGYSNEEIYSAIMNIKTKITDLFSHNKSKNLNVIAQYPAPSSHSVSSQCVSSRLPITSVSPFLMPHLLSSSNTPIEVKIPCRRIICSGFLASVTLARRAILPPSTINVFLSALKVSNALSSLLYAPSSSSTTT